MFFKLQEKQLAHCEVTVMLAPPGERLFIKSLDTVSLVTDRLSGIYLHVRPPLVSFLVVHISPFVLIHHLLHRFNVAAICFLSYGDLRIRRDKRN